MTASPLTVRLEEDALPNTESPPTVSPPVVEALVRVVLPVTSKVPPTVSLPVMVEVPVVKLLAVR